MYLLITIKWIVCFTEAMFLPVILCLSVQLTTCERDL